MKQHLTLAALDEAVRYPDTPVYPGEPLRCEGDAEARTVARNLMADCHQDDLRDPSVVPHMGSALRRWIAQGPTHLVGDHGHLYEHGYARRQKLVLSILDGDHETITSLLDTARRRTALHYQEATSG
ncbi:hypothetical protein [Streptomyces sp. BBFR109]|uniref:hypothetical protein n=1 Tax=Streptomyces sp. BBFR109 TaxID=3448172 RepID=UPI003F76CDB9